MYSCVDGLVLKLSPNCFKDNWIHLKNPNFEVTTVLAFKLDKRFSKMALKTGAKANVRLKSQKFSAKKAGDNVHSELRQAFQDV